MISFRVFKLWKLKVFGVTRNSILCAKGDDVFRRWPTFVGGEPITLPRYVLFPLIVSTDFYIHILGTEFSCIFHYARTSLFSLLIAEIINRSILRTYGRILLMGFSFIGISHEWKIFGILVFLFSFIASSKSLISDGAFYEWKWNSEHFRVRLKFKEFSS